MNMKSILLGTAAALVASGAYAADLPGEAAPAAVDYVKVCDAFGAGFFYIPGSETCLKVTSRVRASVSYNDYSGSYAKNYGSYRFLKSNGDPEDNKNSNVNFRADAYVGFDTRTASDFGTIRTYLEIESDSDQDGTRGALISQAYIQVGYLTVGRQDELGDGDGLYGVNDSTYGPFDFTSTGATLMFDNLGGGFYVGAGVYGNDDSKLNQTVWSDGNGSDLHMAGIVGIAKQAWGDADVSGFYNTYGKSSTVTGLTGDVYGVKGTVNFNIASGLKARLWAAYTNGDDDAVAQLTNLAGFYADSIVDLAAAVNYQATDAIGVYAGVRYQIVDNYSTGKAAAAGLTGFNVADDVIYANVGVDYTLAKGLDLQGEVDYLSQKHYDNLTAVTRLVRVW